MVGEGGGCRVWVEERWDIVFVRAGASRCTNNRSICGKRLTSRLLWKPFTDPKTGCTFRDSIWHIVLDFVVVAVVELSETVVFASEAIL